MQRNIAVGIKAIKVGFDDDDGLGEPSHSNYKYFTVRNSSRLQIIPTRVLPHAYILYGRIGWMNYLLNLKDGGSYFRICFFLIELKIILGCEKSFLDEF